MKPYKGRRSVLAEYIRAFHVPEGAVSLTPWRHGRDEYRIPAVREFAKRAEKAGIRCVAGPVLSGALFAQAVSDAAPLIAPIYLGKPGYHVERHYNSSTSILQPWIFVDDLAAYGTSMKRAASETAYVRPRAVVLFGCANAPLPEKWQGVPIMILHGRR